MLLLLLLLLPRTSYISTYNCNDAAAATAVATTATRHTCTMSACITQTAGLPLCLRSRVDGWLAFLMCLVKVLQVLQHSFVSFRRAQHDFHYFVASSPRPYIVAASLLAGCRPLLWCCSLPAVDCSSPFCLSTYRHISQALLMKT